MKAIVYSKEGKKKGEVVLNPEIYATRVNQGLLDMVRTAYAANLRAGTASTKVRKHVRGGGRKPWKQKGTGRARAGSNRSPIWRGGGIVFGPHPRDYSVNLPKQLRRKAIISALSLKAGQKNLLLLEDAKIDSAKTKDWVVRMEALPIEKKRALCVVNSVDESLKRASKNYLNRVDLCDVNSLNAYKILNREKLLIEQDALENLEKRLLEANVASEEKVAS